MAKSPAAAASILKDVRALLEARADEKEAAKEGKSNGKSKGVPQPRSPLKALGVKPSFVRSIAREIQTKNKPAMDYAGALALMDAAVSRKVREEILVALDVLERYRRDFAAGLFSRVEKWSSVADDLEVAEALGTRVAAPALALEPAKINVLRKWARLRSVGKRLSALDVEAPICGERIGCGVTHDVGARGQMNHDVHASQSSSPIRSRADVADHGIID